MTVFEISLTITRHDRSRLPHTSTEVAYVEQRADAATIAATLRGVADDLGQRTLPTSSPRGLSEGAEVDA